MRSHLLSPYTTQAGINLVEVMVALVITTTGLLGLSTLQLKSMRAAEDSGQRSHAIWMTNDLVNRMRANEITRYEQPQPMRCDQFPAGIKACASYQADDGRKEAEICSGDEMALFDRWDVLCGMPATPGVKTTSLANPSLALTAAADGSLIIDLQWDIRSDGGLNAEGNRQYAGNAVSMRSGYTQAVYP
ncbi:MAG: type IV pilus modification protein PilV [Saccharospirillaceae bacterium]|nr:type IV pilus modification protein PilV [Saccharospirillaceae bacterium]MCD8532271.1 type IV pilus modification protein PilV [Saccharospirillaceae bacterium]